ncbi:hypothetical protein BCV02_10800 [Vibrio breoganii]|nr:hypothetical protein BCV08_10310 [Vibrio breoganii]PMG02687.1 hypothetical protein BCV02_10800 [Vibrio breoganii]PMH22478.1 hypothetical protein BCU74_00125 [Vibrio breoganii]PML86400.1 hypothetical protein BCT67_14035 [Vibrio breoganii]PMM14050.1 hypothetical protein BCT60_11025 [Vibrio breoganii]
MAVLLTTRFRQKGNRVRQLVVAALFCISFGASCAEDPCKTSRAKRLATWAVTFEIPLNTVWVWMYYKGEDVYCYVAGRQERQHHILQINEEYIEELGYLENAKLMKMKHSL